MFGKSARESWLRVAGGARVYAVHVLPNAPRLSELFSSAGPIIEQGTHFCDLSRYFGGDVHLPSVVAHSVQHNEHPGRLSAKRFDEDAIPAENRLPRLTSATWKYTGGAVGALTHVIALHGASPVSCLMSPGLGAVG